jgi:hypothetical protein
MTAPVLSDINSNFASIPKINSNFDKIEESFAEVVHTDVVSTMLVDLDMNDNQLLNLGAPLLPHNAATKSYVDNLAFGTDLATILAISGNVRKVDTYAALTALTTDNGLVNDGLYLVAGRTTAGDGGDGVFRYVAGSVTTANDGTVITHASGRFFRLFTGPVNVKWFGGLGDGQVFYGTGAYTSGSKTLVVTGATFTSAVVGKTVWVQYAAGGGAPLKTTVEAYVNSTTLTMAVAASVTFGAADVFVGADDTAAIDAAVAALVTGQSLYFPRGIYGYAGTSGIALGDGDASTVSTKQSLSLIGENSGAGTFLAGENKSKQGTMIRYIGSTVATYSLDVKGPISFRVENLVFDGGFYATQFCNIKHAINANIKNVFAYNYNTRGVRFGAYATHTGVFTGCSNIICEDVQVSGVGAAAFEAWIFGDGAGLGYDPSLIHLIRCGAFISDDTTAGSWSATGGRTANTSSGFVLGFCDNLVFDQCFVSVSGQRRGNGVLIRPAAGSAPIDAYPLEVSFRDCPLIGGFFSDYTNNTWNPRSGGGRGINCTPYNDGDAADPGYIGVAGRPSTGTIFPNGCFNGFTSSGVDVDRHQTAMERNGVIAYTVSTVARQQNTVGVNNTVTATDTLTFNVPAAMLKELDRTLNATSYKIDRKLRIEMDGSYFNNSGGASNFTVTVTYGGQAMFNSGAISVASIAAYRAIILEVEFGLTNSGVAAQTSIGSLLIGGAGSAGGTAATGGTRYDMSQTGFTVNSDAAQDLKITVQHGTANANIQFQQNSATVKLI